MLGDEEQNFSLGKRLGPLFETGFFRPLARPSAAVYVDCAERLTGAALDAGQIGRNEARLLVREVIEQHPDTALEEDEGGYSTDLNQKANLFFNKLLEAKWISERRISLSEYYIVIAPQLRLLLRALDDVAENRPEELKDFAVGLRSLCKEILADKAFDPHTLDGRSLRAMVKDLRERAERVLNQMHAVENLIGEHETAQRQSTSGRETLKRFLDEFHVGEHILCYDALREAGLLPRITRARGVLQEAAADPFLKERLAEGIRAHSDESADRAYARAEQWLQLLEQHFSRIPQIARQIDARMAEFSNLSAARYRYQTEMRGQRPERVKEYCDRAAKAFSGKKFSDLAHEPGLAFRAVHCEILFGRDSLAPVRTKRLPVNLKLATPTSQIDKAEAREAIRRHNLLTLTPQRAARFIVERLPEKGARLSTEHLTLATEDDLLDLLAVLSFDRGNLARSRKLLRWRVHPARDGAYIPPERIPLDRVGDVRIERLSIERLS
ncbi:MAG: DUF5716 family protein [Opitutales bacterium]|nr:DUF5716 family protein [Opitutales bacterium]